MRFRIFIDEEHEEEVLIYVHEKTPLVDKIEKLISDDTFELIGYKDREAVRLCINDVICFVAEDNKVFAMTESEKFSLRFRLYQIEDNLSDNFIRINQSCIANINMIDRFDASISGTLVVRFKNGYRDFVSRRQVKNVKERFGL